MAADVVTALIAASGAVILAGATYWLTKKREREAELRKEKLEHYKDLVASLSGIISGEGTPDGHTSATIVSDDPARVEQARRGRWLPGRRSCPHRDGAGVWSGQTTPYNRSPASPSPGTM